MEGTIARIVGSRGFGFITTQNGDEYFFHRSGCLPKPESFERLREGQVVTFEIEPSAKGPRATEVQPALSR